jgi:hypothetical protein
MNLIANWGKWAVGTNTGSLMYGSDFYTREFWRFVLVQETVTKVALTAIEYPPMQDPASFNLNAIKAKIQAAIKAHEAQ